MMKEAKSRLLRKRNLRRTAFQIFALHLPICHVVSGKFHLARILCDASPIIPTEDCIEGLAHVTDTYSPPKPTRERLGNVVNSDSSIFSKAGYYFHLELNHLSTHSTKIGGCLDAEKVDNRTQAYLSHVKSSLQVELEYVKKLRSMLTSDSAPIGNEPTHTLCEGSKGPVALIHPKNSSRVLDYVHASDQVPDIAFSSNFNDFSKKSSIINETIWEDWTFVQLFDYFDCADHVLNDNKPLYTEEMWKFLREKYIETGNVPFQSVMKYNKEKLPYHAGFSEGKGRGIFASRDIQKGELVHDGSPSSVFFRDGPSWRRFIMSIKRGKMACDILEWSWMQDVTNTGELLLCLNLDDGAFMNHGGRGEINVAPLSSTSLQFYATRDIKEGEEILQDYDFFDTRWSEFGL